MMIFQSWQIPFDNYVKYLAYPGLCTVLWAPQIWYLPHKASPWKRRRKNYYVPEQYISVFLWKHLIKGLKQYTLELGWLCANIFQCPSCHWPSLFRISNVTRRRKSGQWPLSLSLPLSSSPPSEVTVFRVPDGRGPWALRWRTGVEAGGLSHHHHHRCHQHDCHHHHHEK